ncbi:MAG: hypothetical protein R3194_13095, partial [Limnobacter sp.]|nr:hypothetical protein [Limnobacter sp.]
MNVEPRQIKHTPPRGWARTPYLGLLLGALAMSGAQATPSDQVELANLSQMEDAPAQKPKIQGIDLKLTSWLPPKVVDLTVQADSVWETVEKGFSVPDIDDHIVRKRERALLKNPRALTRILNASKPYIHFVVE